MDYQELLQGIPNRVGEGEGDYLYFTERHLQALWMEQKYFRDLVDSAGRAIEVVSPGLWNGNAGPDFKKAHLRIGGANVLGDIELHLADEGWHQHSHEQDERYGNVVLHVSLWKTKKERALLRHDGKEITRAYLEDRLTVPLARIVQLIDLDLYPYRKFVGSGKCAQQLFSTLPDSNTQELFSAAVRWRQQQKALYLKSRVEDPALRLASGIAMALGYKANTEAFLEVFQWLYGYRHCDQDQMLAMALGACGFFDERFVKHWSDSKHYSHLLHLWRELHPMPTKRWKIDTTRQRPLNHPARRLAILVLLIRDPALPSLFSKLLSCWKQHRNSSSLKEQLLACFPRYHDAYWSSHYIFETTAAENEVPLFGDELMQSVLVNTFLPLLSEIVEEQEESHALMAFLHGLKSPESGKRRYLTHRFFGEMPKGAILKSSLAEQGAFQIHKDFCTHYEASCEGCPFVERVKNSL